MTVQQASRQLLFQLFHIYEEREARNITDLVMEKITEWKRIDRIMNKEVTLSSEKEKLLAVYTAELLNHKPVQYVLNEAWFFGMKLYVDENVLIPRPETEELLNWVLEDIRGRKAAINKPEEILQLIDVGTGSGCIALGLKKEVPLAEVYACDISEKALAVAQKNALLIDTQVHFIECDFLRRESTGKLPRVDIIVSNPPYIPLRDKSGMQPNVLLHEPHLALFVEDDNPLIFYKALAGFGKTHLKKEGAIFAEMHEDMAQQVKDVFLQSEFENVIIRKDLQGKDRMLRAGA